MNAQELIAQRVKEFRHRAGLSQERLAKSLSVSLWTVFRWEHGRSMPQGLSLNVLFERGVLTKSDVQEIRVDRAQGKADRELRAVAVDGNEI